jgi:hypothetical protein
MKGAVAITALALVAACGPAPTEVLLVVAADELEVPAELDALHIEAYGDGAPARLVRDYDLTVPAHALPLSLALVPGAHTGPVLHVSVTGTRGGALVDLQEATTSFVANQASVLEVRLRKRRPALGTSASEDTAVRGPETTAPTVRDVCPAGSVVGFDFSVDQQVVTGLRPRCGIPRVADDGRSIALDPGETLPWAGSDQPGNAPSPCPPDQVVVGFDSRHGLLVDQIALRCAPLELDAASLVTVGPATALPSVGGTGGGPDPLTTCGPGKVATGALTRADGWLQGLGLVCGAVVTR